MEPSARTVRLGWPIGIVLAAPVISCGGGVATTGSRAADAAPAAPVNSASSDAASSSADSAPALEAAGLDEGSEGADASVPAADGPTEVGADAWCEGPPCPTPVFCPAGGPLALAAMGVAIATPEASGSTIYYTTDGTIPTHQSAVYAGPIFLGGAGAIHAMSYQRCGCTDSLIATAVFTVTPPPGDAGAASCVATD